MHNPLSCTSWCSSAFLPVSLVPIVCRAPLVANPFGPLRCIPVFPMGALGSCACMMVRCSCLCPLASGLGSVREVPCSLCCGSVAQCGCRRPG